MRFSVELDRGPIAALEDHVHLRMILMIMFAGITADLGQVNGTWKLIAIGKRASGESAGTLHRCNRSQIDNFGFGTHAVNLSG